MCHTDGNDIIDIKTCVRVNDQWNCALCAEHLAKSIGKENLISFEVFEHIYLEQNEEV